MVVTGPDSFEVDLAMFVMRIIFGGLFFWHGCSKLTSRGRTEKIARMFESYGLRPGSRHVYSAAAGLMLCGVCVVVGVMTTVAASGMVALMVVAWWTVRRGKGVLAVEGGWELTLIYSAVAGVVALLGPGDLSLDAAFGVRVQGLGAMVVALCAGVLGGTLFLGLFCRSARRNIVLNG